MISIELNGTDITNNIEVNSLNVSRNLTDQVDSGSFSSKDLRPTVGDEIEIFLDSSKEFGGYITEVNSRFSQATAVYDCDFVDYTYEMDQQYVIDSFEDQTVTEIIEYIVNNYLPDGFSTNSTITTTIDRIVFNSKKPSECFEDLADTVGYEWYLDEDKVINFFERGSISGQAVTPDNEIAFWSTIEYSESIEQLKNKVFIKGGKRTSTNEIEQSMDEQIDGNNDILKTGYTYIYRRNASGDVIEPTITYNGVEQDIGIENEDSFDASTASLTTTNGENTNITYTAADAGSAGNDISVEYVINSANQELSSSVTSDKITLLLESNYESNPRSTASEVVSELQSNSDVTDIVSVSLAIGSDGSGIVQEMTETSLSGGAEGKTILYNQDEKVVKTQTPVEVTNKPVLISGRIRQPIQIVIDDRASQEEYNFEISHLINDDSIASIDEAEKKALAELEKFADKLESGRFSTHDTSYRPGQQFRLNVPEFSLDKEFVVRSVDLRHDGGGEFYHTITYITKRSKKLIDLLKRLLRKEREPEEINEILAKIANIFEEVEWEDNFVEQPFPSDEIEWVAGRYYPSGPTDRKRVPRANGGAKAQ